MYHHSFLFVIVSSSKRVESVLREIAPLEDCDYTFQTVPCGREAVIDAKRPDVAFVYDSVGGAAFSGEEGDREERVLVASAGSPLLTDTDAAAAVSDLWVMPGQEGYDDGLLTIGFQRLAKRMKDRADARKQSICFETLIDSVPDISWFKDTEGAHLIVNDSFCEMVGKSKAQIYKQGHCYIWDASKKDEEVCLESDRIIMESRQTNTFEERIKTRTEVRLLKSYKSALIDVNGEIFGTCGIAHDVTTLRNMSTELDIVLDSVPFVVLVEDMQGIVLNKNSQFDKNFPQFIDIVGQSSEEWRQSLRKKMLMEEQLREVVVKSGEEEQVLVFDEEPIRDNFGRDVGKIITLTDITLERSIYKQSEHRANTDYLTGLGNRRSLMQYLEAVYADDNAALVMVDMDNFKQVNDTYGHEAGDRALVMTAQKLKECFEDAFAARMGGDEFMVVISGESEEEVRRDTGHMLEIMRKAYGEQEEFRGITVSAGVIMSAAIPAQERNISELLQAVDRMLYKAKHNGKNCYCVYGEE